jgi:hypothetical protein
MTLVIGKQGKIKRYSAASLGAKKFHSAALKAFLTGMVVIAEQQAQRDIS